MKARFRILAYEEGGKVRSQEEPNVRLVCITDANEKLVLWGTEKVNTSNIDRVLQKGLPCELECEYREPEEYFRTRFGHTYWVPQGAKVEIV